MTQVNREMTEKVAKLARVQLTEEEKEAFTQQLSDVFSHVEKLQEVDVSQVEPMTHPSDRVLRMRADELETFERDAQGRSRVLESAPETIDDGYRVPPVL